MVVLILGYALLNDTLWQHLKPKTMVEKKDKNPW